MYTKKKLSNFPLSRDVNILLFKGLLGPNINFFYH